jgi:hypothetical protein
VLKNASLTVSQAARGVLRFPQTGDDPKNTRIRRQEMKVTCDQCRCNMKITSSFRYLCPECKNEIEMAHVQEMNKKHWDEHHKNMEWVKIKGTEIIMVE